MKNILLPIIFLLLSSILHAQPQWKFHVAFEDATGAKDTLWMIYRLHYPPLSGQTLQP